MLRALRFGTPTLALFAMLIAAAIANNNYPESSGSRSDFEARRNHSLNGSSEWMASQIRAANMFGRCMVQDCATLSGDASLQDFLKRVAKYAR